jgi:hypothetical protein
MKKLLIVMVMMFSAGCSSTGGTGQPFVATQESCEAEGAKYESLSEMPADVVKACMEMSVEQLGGTETDTTAPVDEPEMSSSCDVVREALLTGTQAEVDAAMRALKADATADATAREYADEYLINEYPENRNGIVSAIRTFCS